jgi:CspA family cold shock protein
MATETDKWFNPTNGFGFMQSDGGDKDGSAASMRLSRLVLSALTEGQCISHGSSAQYTHT